MTVYPTKVGGIFFVRKIKMNTLLLDTGFLLNALMDEENDSLENLMLFMAPSVRHGTCEEYFISCPL